MGGRHNYSDKNKSSYDRNRHHHYHHAEHDERDRRHHDRDSGRERYHKSSRDSSEHKHHHTSYKRRAHDEYDHLAKRPRYDKYEEHHESNRKSKEFIERKDFKKSLMENRTKNSNAFQAKSSNIPSPYAHLPPSPPRLKRPTQPISLNMTAESADIGSDFAPKKENTIEKTADSHETNSTKNQVADSSSYVGNIEELEHRKEMKKVTSTYHGHHQNAYAQNKHTGTHEANEPSKDITVSKNENTGKIQALSSETLLSNTEKLNRSSQVPIKNKSQTHCIENTTEKDSHKYTGNVVSKWSKTFDKLKTNDGRVQSNITQNEENKIKNKTAGNESCNKNTGILKGPFTTSTSGSNSSKTSFMADSPTKQTNTPKESQFFKNTGFSKQAPMNSNSCIQQLHHEKDKTNRDNYANNDSYKNTGKIYEHNLKYANKDNPNMNIQPQENNENTGNFAQPHTSRQSQYLKNTGYSNHIPKKSNLYAQQLQDDGEKTNRNNKDFKKNTGKIIEAAIESNLKYTNKVNPNIDIQALENNGKQHNENTGKFSHTNILNKVAPPYVNKAQCDDGKNSNSKSDTSNFNAPNKNTGSFSKESSAKFTSQCRITQAENQENMCNKSSFNSSLNPDPGVVKQNSGHFPPNVNKFNGPPPSLLFSTKNMNVGNPNSNLNKNTGIPHMHRYEKPDGPMSQTSSEINQNAPNDTRNSANNFNLNFSKNTGIPTISYNDKPGGSMNQSPSKFNQNVSNNGSMANNLTNTGNFIPPNMRFDKPPPAYGLPKITNEENRFTNQFGNFQNQQNTGINPRNFPPNFTQPPPTLVGNMEFRHSQEKNATNSNRNNFENTINQNNGNYTGFYKRPPAYGNNTQSTGINYSNLKGNQNNGNFTGNVVRQNIGNFSQNPHEYNFPSPHGYNAHITSQPHRYDENNPRNVELDKNTGNFSNNKNSICKVPAPYNHNRGHNMPATQSSNEMNKHFTNNTGNMNNNKNTGNRMENNNNNNWEQTTNQIRSSNEIANRFDKNLKNTGDFYKENIRLEDNKSSSYEANKNTGNNDICGNKPSNGPPEVMGDFEKENISLPTMSNQNPFDDKLLQAVQFDVTVPPPPLNGNENGKYSKNIQFGMRRRTNIRLVDHKMDRHFGIKKQFSKFGNKEITKYPARRGFNTQQIAKSNDNTFQINPSFGGNQRFYEDINPAPPVENVNPANNMQNNNNNNGGQQLRQNHQQYSNHNPRMKPFDNRNGRPLFKYQHLQKPLPGIGKFNQRGFINRAPSVRGRLVQRGNRKPIPLLKSSLKHNFQKKLSRAVIGAQNKYAKKPTKSKSKTTKTEQKKSKKTKTKPKDTCPDQETAGDDHIDINKQVFGDFKPIQVNGKKSAKGHLKPDPEEYWKQWWSLYGYVEHSIAPVDRNDPTVASVLDFQLTPNDKEFRKRKRVLLTMGVAKILKHIRINETDYALRDIFNVLKYRHQLEDSKFQQYLSTKEMQRLEMVLKNARKKTRRAFFYQSMICRWHFSTQIVQRAESGEQLKVGHARKLLANKVFLYFVCESIQELKKLIIEDWPGFEEYYNSLQST